MHSTNQLVHEQITPNFSQDSAPHQLNSTSAGGWSRGLFARSPAVLTPHGTRTVLEDLHRRTRLVGRGGGEAAARSAEAGHERPLRLFPRASPGPPHQTDIFPPHTRARLTCGWAGTRRRRASLRDWLIVLLDQAGERVGDRIQRSRDVLVPNRDEGALELLGILVERHEALR